MGKGNFPLQKLCNSTDNSCSREFYNLEQIWNIIDEFETLAKIKNNFMVFLIIIFFSVIIEVIISWNSFSWYSVLWQKNLLVIYTKYFCQAKYH